MPPEDEFGNSLIGARLFIEYPAFKIPFISINFTRHQIFILSYADASKRKIFWYFKRAVQHRRLNYCQFFIS